MFDLKFLFDEKDTVAVVYGVSEPFLPGAVPPQHTNLHVGPPSRVFPVRTYKVSRFEGNGTTRREVSGEFRSLPLCVPVSGFIVGHQ